MKALGFRAWLVPALFLIVSSCVTLRADKVETGEASDSKQDAAMGSAARDDGAEAASRKDEDDAHRLEWARVDLRVAEITAELQRMEAKRAIDDANKELAEARTELEDFEAHERPMKLADAHLDLDYAVQRRHEAQAELAELEAMYAAEEFAEATKELVLQRGRKQLEFAERRLEMQRQNLEHLEARELPLEAKKRAFAVERAERALHMAERRAERTELESTVAVDKARKEVLDLERDRGDARP